MGENLKEKIEKDFKEALKKRDLIAISTLRLLKSAILNKEIEKGSSLSEEEIFNVIVSEIKKRREAISEYQKGKREDLMEREKKELEILTSYVGEELNEQEIRKMVNEIIEKIKPTGPKDIGKIMKEIMPKVKGRADGNLVAKIVRESLEEI